MTMRAESSSGLALVRAGWSQLETQRPLAAWAAWQRATRLDPDNRAAKEALDLLAGASDLPKALKVIHRLKSPRGDRERARWDAVLATASADDLEQLARLFQTLCAEDASDAEARFNEALAQAWLGNNAEARQRFEQYGSRVAASNPEGASEAFVLARFLAQGEPPRFESPIDWNYTLVIETRDPTGPLVDRVRSLAEWVERPFALELTEPRSLSAGMQAFEWLDRPMPGVAAISSADDLPRVLASVIVTPSGLRFSSTDRWRLKQVEWLLAQAIAGSAYSVARQSSPLPIRLMDAAAWMFRLPPEIDDDDRLPLSREAIELFYENEWARQPRYGLVPSETDFPVSPLVASRLAPSSPHGAEIEARLQALIHTREQLADRPMTALPQTGYPFDRLRNRLGLKLHDGDLVDPSDVSCMSERQLEALQTDLWEIPLLHDAFRSAYGLLGRSAAVVGRLARQIVDRDGDALAGTQADALLDAAVCSTLTREDLAQAVGYLDRYDARTKPEDARPSRRAYIEAWRAAIAAEKSAGGVDGATALAQSGASLEARGTLQCANRLLDLGFFAEALPLMLDVFEHSSDPEARDFARRLLEYDPLAA
jgi:hypothetical protein